MPSNVRPSPPSGQELLAKYRKAMDLKNKDGHDPNTWRGKNLALDKWHELVEMYKMDEASTGLHSKDMRSQGLSILSEILHDDVVFHPPTYWNARHGKMLVGIIMGEVSSISRISCIAGNCKIQKARTSCWNLVPWWMKFLFRASTSSNLIRTLRSHKLSTSR
mmetsp:Transcript_61938/g.119397  ORF Transcript_61938/g.119397 Transcript_61938/m.119397 type:complete len:163 (-) Transcript_61938:232-720(-)